jgi:hypothetical protein
MRWDLLREDQPELIWVRQLIALRKQNRALRIGDFRRIESEKLFAFERHTDRALEAVLIVANPSGQAVTERLMVADSNLLDDTPLVDAFHPEAEPVSGVGTGFFTVTVPPRSVRVLRPKERQLGGYSRYKRVP